MPKVTINNMEIEVEQGTSILQAAETIGVEIPRFCYHDRLSVPANCRMCLVEVEGGPPKPVASCAMACSDGMVVKTESEMVKKARKGVMEMLLINHPLDCPICDQGGECDLQDQAYGYGFDRSRFHENKRAVKDKDLGPLIKTVMTRCINCTRCVRFAEEIAGTPVLGQFNRGEDAEIGTYINEIVNTELSGNLVDICPVGALTSKPYAFKARSWELEKTETIDVHDAVGSNIRVDSRGREVMRILPRLHEEVNEEWISDRSRYSYDGLAKSRLDRPFVRDEESGKLREADWNEAFDLIKARLSGLKGEEIAAFAGDLADVESVVALKDFMTSLGSPNMDCRTDGAYFDETKRAGYLFNSGISGIDEADAILLVGTNPRHEATIINARIRRAWLERKIPISLVGEAVDLTYPYVHLGDFPKSVENLVKEYAGKVKSKKPMMIVGMNAFRRPDGQAIHGMLQEAAEDLGIVKKGWNGFNILHDAAGRVGALDVGFVPQKGGKGFADILAGTKDGSIKVLFMLNADEFNARVNVGWKTFVVYIGHHGDHGAQRADVVLPSAAYTEKDALYVNTEGRVQMAKRAVSPPGDARVDWTILRAISNHIDKPLPYDSQHELRDRVFEEWPHLSKIDQIELAKWGKFGKKTRIQKDAFAGNALGYYLTNAICRASPTMNKCTQAFKQDIEYKEAAE
ncbi:MAG: NADH-quinone oxidoreductase subunit NuoG [Alphaproteobacteria bacterium]|nr:NADH-quinone oxidoreductase subunit NuoG [Alphaproteobacteria bacterium]